MKRRELLKALTYSAMANAACLHHLSFGAQAKSTLVFVFLRGGADSLQMAAPVDDANYIAARPPELRILSSGSSPGLQLPIGFSSNQDCRLHPAAAPLLDLFQSKHAQILHACGLANATRSHFVAQEILESSLNDHNQIKAKTPGWLQPLIKPSANPNAKEVIANLGTSAGKIKSLEGLTFGMNVSGELRSNLVLPGDASAKLVLEALYQTDPADVHGNEALAMGKETLQQLSFVESKMPRVDGKLTAYTPAKGVQYNTENNDLLHALQTVAQLIRMDVGLQVACVDFGGWDTHENQSGRINQLIRQWSSNMRAFFDDMQAAGKPVTIAVVSEFGRRLRANASQGTDHGHAGAMWLLDTQARQRLPATVWPGLTTSALDQGLDLASTHNVKQVLAQVAQQALNG